MTTSARYGVVAAALREARAIIAADAHEGRIEPCQQIDVEDKGGVIVQSLQFEEAVQISKGALT
jgi:hypothetical protein